PRVRERLVEALGELVTGGRLDGEQAEDGVAEGHRCPAAYVGIDICSSNCNFRHMDTAALSPRRQRLVIAALLSGLLLAMLDQTIVGTALPRIVSELGRQSTYLCGVPAYSV